MGRNVIILAVVIIFIVGAGSCGLPFLKRVLFGGSKDAKANVLKAVLDEEVEDKDGDLVKMLIVDLEIFFPMGSAPNHIQELEVQDERGLPVGVGWGSNIDKEDIEDQQVTRWRVKEAQFPPRFRKGSLHNKVRKLCDIEIKDTE